MPSTVNGDDVQLENTEGGCQNSNTLLLEYSNVASKEGLERAGVVKRTCSVGLRAAGSVPGGDRSRGVSGG